MTTATSESSVPPMAAAAARPAPGPVKRPGFAVVVRAEWLKLLTVHSTMWTLLATFVLGAGVTTLICAANADRLAGAEEAPGSFVTWGMLLAQICAVVIGALVVTTEYTTGMINSTFAAVPVRGKVLAAKALVITVVMFVVGGLAAIVGYAGGNAFLDAEGVAVPLDGVMVRSLFGCAIMMAGMALFTVAMGFLLRHTAGTIAIVLGLMLIVGNLANLIPGAVGEFITKTLPGNAINPITTPVPFNTALLGPWEGLAVFGLETGVLLWLAWLLLRLRDA